MLKVKSVTLNSPSEVCHFLKALYADGYSEAISVCNGIDNTKFVVFYKTVSNSD